jgi:hypothetical protein
MADKSKVNVDSIVNLSGTGAVTLSNSATIPNGGRLTINGNLNVGVATVSTLSASDINATTITATSFVGDGSQLSGLPVTSASKTIALTLIS